ncbi:YjdF family protein [uncultured Clostridium sp.]|uniref:YjdF family protein n=1 Tax=uncultured Clostridium sp. TaxID=59620 RepID=UPI0028E6D687|nr:YjdF family protein [uncultured Clostridium sp.]
MLISVKLTVLFNEPFWIGVFEIEEGEYYKVSKVTFGSEPKEEEIFNFVLKNYYSLKFALQEIEDEKYLKKRENPKRAQRAIKKELKSKGIGTKAQIAIKEQHETNKIQRKKKSKEEKESEQIRKFEIKQNKKKKKHKGH